MIKRIFDAVLLLRHWPVDKVSWIDTKGAMVVLGTYDVSVKMMSDMGFLTALMNFPKVRQVHCYLLKCIKLSCFCLAAVEVDVVSELLNALFFSSLLSSAPSNFNMY